MTTTAQALRDLAAAAQLISSATTVLADPDLAPGHAACFALLSEQLGQQQTRTQIHAAHALRRTGAHKLDQPSFQAVNDATSNPTPQAFDAAAGHTTTGRTHFKSARGLMQDWLNIPRGTAGDRLIQVDCLLGGVNDAGESVPAWLPQLAPRLDDLNVDPRLLVAASMKLYSARKDLGDGSTARRAKDRLQSESLAFIHAEPKSARKHINDLVAQVKSGKRPLKALLEGIGIYKKGLHQGLIEYVLRVLPSQAAVIEAYFAGLDNPATVAGNREALKDAEAQFTDEPASEWDDRDSMPDWAKDDACDDDATRDPDADQTSDASQPEQTSEDCEPSKGSVPSNDEEGPAQKIQSPSAPWEDLKPERRRLVGFMALLMTDRTGSGSPSGHQPGMVTPQVSIILNYEKMLTQAEDFAVTASGIQLSAGEARAALCTAGIIPLVLNGKSLPLDLGRTQRLFSKAQGRAVRAAYRGCSYPGCSMPAQRCELDHLDAWEKGGNTDVRSSALGCPIHHTARHCGLFHAVKIPGCRPMVLLPGELDPEQKLRVNTYFMTPAEALEAEALADRMTQLWRAGHIEVEIVQP